MLYKNLHGSVNSIVNKQVSVIVPNYNYARFLHNRLESIVNQTVKPSEIIFLDDCSTDNSLEIAGEILKSYEIPYRIISNEVNQGVFKQWLKGIELARYDYLWIAEADDYCELNFLENLLPAFNNENVILSYCQSKLVNANGDFIRANYDNIAAVGFDVTRWLHDYINSCYDEACNYLSVASTISNASGVLLNKKMLPMSMLYQVTEFKMAGDWFFYLITLFENPEKKVSYCAKFLNYWCQHDASVWADTGSQLRGAIECLRVYNTILKLYHISLTSKTLLFDIINKHYFNYVDTLYVNLLWEVCVRIGVETYGLQLKSFIEYKCISKHDIIRLNQECLNRDNEINRLIQHINDKDNYINTLNKECLDKDHHVDVLYGEYLDQHHRLIGFDEKLNELYTFCKNKQIEVETLKNEITLKDIEIKSLHDNILFKISRKSLRLIKRIRNILTRYKK